MPRKNYADTPSKYIPQELWDKWLEHANPLLERDGTDPQHKNGGHDIKNSPELTELVHQVATNYLEVIPTIIERRYEEKRFEKHPGVARLGDKMRPSPKRTYLYMQEAIKASIKSLEIIQSNNIFREEVTRISKYKFIDDSEIRSKAVQLLSSVLGPAITAADEYVREKEGYPEPIDLTKLVVPTTDNLDRWMNAPDQRKVVFADMLLGPLIEHEEPQLSR